MPPEDRTIAALALARSPEGLTVEGLMTRAGIKDRLARRIIAALLSAGLVLQSDYPRLGRRKVWRAL